MSATRKRGKPDIASVLEREIIERGLSPGTRLPGEEALGARFGASRPAVREALQSLKARGLIASRRGSGSYVAERPAADGVRDSLALYSALRRDAPSFLELLDLRLLVESFCTRALAGAPERAAGLTENLRRMEAAAGDMESFGREDIAFHLALVEATGHALFSNILRGLLPSLGIRFALETYTDPSLIPAKLADHRAILRLILRGDADGAEARVRRHLGASRRHLEQLVASQEYTGR